MDETTVLDRIITELESLKGEEIAGYLSIDGPIEWDSIPKDEDSLTRIIGWFYNYKRGIVVAYSGSEYEPGGDYGGGVIQDYMVTATISCICIYDRIRNPKEGTLAALDMAKKVKTKLSGQDLDLAIAPLIIVSDYEVFSTMEAVAWCVDFVTEWEHTP